MAPIKPLLIHEETSVVKHDLQQWTLQSCYFSHDGNQIIFLLFPPPSLYSSFSVTNTVLSGSLPETQADCQCLFYYRFVEAGCWLACGQVTLICTTEQHPELSPLIQEVCCTSHITHIPCNMMYVSWRFAGGPLNIETGVLFPNAKATVVIQNQV